MFDPRTYRDVDFGLAADESFEPDDGEGDGAFDDTQPHVMTILGPIVPDELGVCLAHERLSTGSVSTPPDDGGVTRGGWRSIGEELEAFALSGGRAVVDASLPNDGRDAAGLLDLVRYVPVHIVASTGWWADPARDPTDTRSDPDAILARLLGDLRSGMDGSAARAGVIAIDGVAEPSVLEASAAAHRETGAPMAVRLEPGRTADALLDLLSRFGVSSRAVIAQGLDRTTPLDALRRLAERGVTCSFDRIQGDPALDRDEARAIVGLVEAGYDRAPVLSMGVDWSRRAPPGRPRWPYLLEQFSVYLMELGIDAGTIRRLLVENPAHALTVRPTRD